MFFGHVLKPQFTYFRDKKKHFELNSIGLNGSFFDFSLVPVSLIIYYVPSDDSYHHRSNNSISFQVFSTDKVLFHAFYALFSIPFYFIQFHPIPFRFIHPIDSHAIPFSSIRFHPIPVIVLAIISRANVSFKTRCVPLSFLFLSHSSPFHPI